MIRTGLFVLLVASCSSAFVRLVEFFDLLRTLLLLLLLKKGKGKFILQLSITPWRRMRRWTYSSTS
jgi:hypothetical protein